MKPRLEDRKKRSNPAVRCLRAFGLWAVFLWLVVSPVSGDDNSAPPRNMKVHGAVIPIYSDSQQLVAVLRLEHEFPDFQTKGFFRIGVLPMTVIEGARLEIFLTNGLAKSFFAATTRLQKRFPNGAIELRRFSVCLPGGREPFLVADSAQPVGGGWNLKGRVQIRSNNLSYDHEKGMITQASDGSVIISCVESGRPVRHVLIPAGQ